MLRFDRVGVVAAVVGVVAVGLATGANARDATRDYPAGWCPVHTPGPVVLPGQTEAGDPFLFKAGASSALLTFVSCDGRSVNGVPYAVHVAIDNLLVVDLDVYNRHRKTYEEVAADRGYPPSDSGKGCYFRDADSVTYKVKDVFDRDKKYKRWAVPFAEDFQGSARGWSLGNACFSVDDDAVDPCVAPSPAGSAKRSLILSRALTDGSQCSVASVKVDGLTRGRYYVADFDWRVPDTSIAEVIPAPTLSFFVSNVP
jgi:hypothetical protein